MDKNKKLYRSQTQKMLAGICGGFAEYLGVDATLIRVIYVLLSVFTAAFPGIILYIILYFVIPQDPGYVDI